MSQSNHFQTSRLHVTHWAECTNNSVCRQKLIAELKPILTSAVLRHLPEPLQLSDHPDAIDVWITERAAESDVMVIRDKSTVAVLGLLILAEMPEPNASSEIHLGYLFAETAWGKGYATELLSGLINWYKTEDRSVQLIGGVETDNIASAKVLQKNGFEKIVELSDTSNEMFVLAI